jgi:hypothetical protein
MYICLAPLYHFVGSATDFNVSKVDLGVAHVANG